MAARRRLHALVIADSAFSDLSLFMQLSLGKNVPVYELRPMTHSELAKLPQAVRGLIKVVDKS
jgi:hypothetical protein